jgi:hypothetical protein
MRFSSSIRFNPLKHHLSWVKECIATILKDAEKPSLQISFIEEVKAINSNQVDIYTGAYSTEQIIQQIEEHLKAQNIYSRHSFSEWLGKHNYQEIKLNDSSIWILRLGVEEDLYVHIHPARNSPNAIRIHGNSWKTAIVADVLYPGNENLELSLINKLRKEYLDLSPVKDLYSSQRIIKARMLLKRIVNGR